MREILFRGKRIDNGEWVYGVPIFDEYQWFIIEEVFEYDEYACVETESKVVLSKTIGQYTGLKDNNGNRIFEGDILELCMDGKVVIEFDEGIFGAHFEEYGLLPLRRSLFGEGGIIIGNIHDNPELLEEA